MSQKVTTGVYKGVTTSELDELAAETAASLTATHPDYALVRFTLSSVVVLRACCQHHQPALLNRARDRLAAARRRSTLHC